MELNPTVHRTPSFWLGVVLSVFDAVYAFLPVAKDVISVDLFTQINLALGLAIVVARSIKQNFPD